MLKLEPGRTTVGTVDVVGTVVVGKLFPLEDVDRVCVVVLGPGKSVVGMDSVVEGVVVVEEFV